MPKSRPRRYAGSHHPPRAWGTATGGKIDADFFYFNHIHLRNWGWPPLRSGCRGHPFRFLEGAINILWIVDNRAISRRFHRLDNIFGKRLIGIFTAYRNDIFQILIRCSCLIALERSSPAATAKFPLTSAPVTPSSVRGSCAASSGLKTSPFGLLAISRSEALVGSILSLIVISPNDCRKRRPRASWSDRWRE